MPITGSKLVATNILLYGQGFLNTVNKTMGKVKVLMDKEVTKNMSLTDHTPQELRKLGHPYAKKHGPQGLGLHSPNYQIHKQSGRLLSSKFSGTKQATVLSGKLEASAFVGLDASKAEHAPSVIYGTSKMIPRPVLGESRNNVLQEAYDLIKGNLTDLTFNFKGIRTNE